MIAKGHGRGRKLDRTLDGDTGAGQRNGLRTVSGIVRDLDDVRTRSRSRRRKCNCNRTVVFCPSRRRKLRAAVIGLGVVTAGAGETNRSDVQYAGARILQCRRLSCGGCADILVAEVQSRRSHCRDGEGCSVNQRHKRIACAAAKGRFPSRTSRGRHDGKIQRLRGSGQENIPFLVQYDSVCLIRRSSTQVCHHRRCRTAGVQSCNEGILRTKERCLGIARQIQQGVDDLQVR